MRESISWATEQSVERRLDHRELAERVLNKASNLCGTERVMVEQVYRHGVSMSDLSQLRGESAVKTRRRLARTLWRMNGPLYVFMELHGELLPQAVRRTATLVVYHGCSLRQAARATGTTLHYVRQHMRVLRVLAELSEVKP